MNREQAENILEAYIDMERGGCDDKARQSLREVILDAMTEYTEYRSKPTTTWPGITVNPMRWDGPPKVTCTGVDPAFNAMTVRTVGCQDGVAEVVER